MNKKHPDPMLINQYSLGKLDDVHSILVSAHLELCSSCRHQYQHQLETEANNQLGSKSKSNGSSEIMLDKQEMDAMLATIMASAKVDPQPKPHPIIDYRGQDFKLPKALAPLVAKKQAWSNAIGKIWRAKVAEHGQDYQIDFLYIEPGGKVAEHTHKGQEWTLVLEGSFSDGINEYKAGDLSLMDDSNTHTPVSEQGCLCLSVINAPLQFTSGTARLLNPFSNLFYKAG
ncbi:ChrR family anti-sigma-E factor [Paraferrimonas sp. SM1919]|uniref:ChrR family anti-sigma-E factor n=1 Tax=Paraferrimonas sp. SM1919 TaxID=2662263 RepID=UPI0013D8468E|nr:ChrR family anti-sigma-E factor [Paraferrimonas sp. SM1919]